MELLLLLHTAVMMGEALMKYGAEVYRVEQTIERISKTYGAKEVDVFAIPSSIVVTMSLDGVNFQTKTKRILSRSTDLDKIDRLNSLSRRACAEKIDLVSLQEEISVIKKNITYSPMQQLLAYSFAAGSFTLFFGGDVRDAFYSLFIGAVVNRTSVLLGKLHSNPFFTTVLSSGLIAAAAFTLVQLGLAQRMDRMITGSIMLLVPGIAVTNSMRDIINGDLISGSLKLVEAFIVATAIAVGATGTLSFAYKLMEVMA